MTPLSRDLVFLILQFLKEEKFKESVHRLERDSGLFFNMKYFEEKALAGKWDEVETYLSGFTRLDDNKYSMQIYFEIRKQKYLEALDRHDKAKAFEVLVNDLKVFSASNENLYKEITQLITLDSFRQNEQLSKCTDVKSARSLIFGELKELIEANPLLREKLVFPTLEASRLRTLINQSLTWQHDGCRYPTPNPKINTLFSDHTCSPPNGARAPTPVTLPVVAVTKSSTFAPPGAHGFPFTLSAAAANANALAGRMENVNPPLPIQSAVVATSPISVNPIQGTPSNSFGMIDYQGTEHEQLMERPRSAQSVDKQASWSLDDLPRTVVCKRHQGSNVTSMDFHPSYQTLLAVGCNSGEITLWEVAMQRRLVKKPFNLWDMASCTAQFQAVIAKDSSISVSRLAWSPDGSLIGVAFTKHLVHLYVYQGPPNDFNQHLEIDAHVGGVNDLAFSQPNKQLCIVTCGDDKLVKVWDLGGRKLFNFEGHGAPVFSVCPHQRENIQFIFSTAVDGKIKFWTYDNVGSRVDFDAPGQWCTTMLYSADGSRLFSCGTSKDGDSFLVEWDESKGAIKRTYSGFRKSAGIVQFDTTKNRFLAAGDDNQIKFWDMDNTNMLTSTEAEGGLLSLPCLKFNKAGSLLVVTTSDNGFKVLANAVGIRMLQSIKARFFQAFRLVIEMKDGVESVGRGSDKTRVFEDVPVKMKPRELTEIVDSAQCQTVTMTDNSDPASKVARILYTNSGAGILALGSNGVQKLWKWSHNDQNPSGKAAASIAAQHWQPNSGLVMTNDLPENYEDAIPCIALSNNDSYVMSACGGRISLFNMMTFKVMVSFMAPPPASTFLVFHPQDNNIMAIGMEDSTIHIYHFRVDEVKTKLRGHQKRITGLAFSSSHSILVSSGGDAQLLFWNTDTWEKRKSIMVQLPVGKVADGDTRVQFHSDQVRLLVCHETQLAIYDTSKFECIRQWVPQDALASPITCAAYSCNSQLVYATFADGNIAVFDADSLSIRCCIAPSAYVSSASSNSQTPYPIVVTAHPQEPTQFAVGLSDGSVTVIEPLETEKKWGVPSVDNGAENGSTATLSATNTSEQ